MTIISLQELAAFLNTYKVSGRIADYGGTSEIGARIVRQMLGFEDVGIKEDLVDDMWVGLVMGSAAKETVPTYHPLDYNNGVDLLLPIEGEPYDAGISMDLLEHTSQPFIVAENISNSLKPGALLFVTVPFVWEVHNYPGDYWRFTPQGLATLFPKMKQRASKIIRDQSPEEELPRTRIVAVFQKI